MFAGHAGGGIALERVGERRAWVRDRICGSDVLVMVMTITGKHRVPLHRLVTLQQGIAGDEGDRWDSDGG